MRAFFARLSTGGHSKHPDHHHPSKEGRPVLDKENKALPLIPASLRGPQAPSTAAVVVASSPRAAAAVPLPGSPPHPPSSQQQSARKPNAGPRSSTVPPTPAAGASPPSTSTSTDHAVTELAPLRKPTSNPLSSLNGRKGGAASLATAPAPPPPARTSALPAGGSVQGRQQQPPSASAPAAGSETASGLRKVAFSSPSTTPTPPLQDELPRPARDASQGSASTSGSAAASSKQSKPPSVPSKVSVNLKTRTQSAVGSSSAAAPSLPAKAQATTAGAMSSTSVNLFKASAPSSSSSARPTKRLSDAPVPAVRPAASTRSASTLGATSTPTLAAAIRPKKASSTTSSGSGPTPRSISSSTPPLTTGSTTRKFSAAPKLGGPSASSRSIDTATASATRSASPLSTRSSLGPPSTAGTSPYLGAGQGSSSFVGAHHSWSEWADQDLLLNLGPRERTRQEVLWEIVSSEERYVNDLVALVNTFVHALLPPRQQLGSPTLDSWSPPLGSDPSGSPWNMSAGPSPTKRSHSPLPAVPLSSGRPIESIESNPPIAARFLSSTPPTIPPLFQDGDPVFGSWLSEGTPADSSSTNTSLQPSSVVCATRPHTSLPPQPRAPSAASLAPPSTAAAPPRATSALAGSTRRLQKVFSGGSSHSGGTVSTGLSSDNGAGGVLGLPDDLRQVLEVLRDGIFPGHLALCAALRRRHEEQYPLVRSLADVFNRHASVLKEYSVYVLHLSNALGVVDSALSSGIGKKAQKAEAGTEVARLRAVFQELDELASDRGESGLAISLSKPFQRLLKYPLLLQNLLYNTDPSTKEYEATLAMVEDVEAIIRSIEDEKTAVEERVRTRDVYARIEGLERDKMLIAPKPSRLLIDETPCGADGTKISEAAAARRQAAKVKEKKAFRRLSDIMKSHVGGSTDLWIVHFNDVSLLCQRTGTTDLPLASTAASRTGSLPDLNGKAKFATTGRKHTPARARNLYRFIKVEQWNIHKPVLARGMTSLEDISRTRASMLQSGQGDPDERDEDANEEALDDGSDSDGSSFGAKSRMSFSYQGGDVVEPAPPLPTSGIRSATPSGRRSGSSTPAVSTAAFSRASTASTRAPAPPLVRRSSATAQEKFGNRLRSPEPYPGDGPRPTSRARSTASRTVVRKTSTTPALKPAWNSSSSVAPASAASAAGRSTPAGRASSTTATTSANAAKAASITASKHLSPSVSEDSDAAMGLLYVANND